MGYLVIACKSCGTPRVAQDDKQTAECHRCGTQTRIEDARVHARTDELAEAQDAVGQVNAQRAGGQLARPDEGEAAPGGEAETVSPRDDIDQALTRARTAASERTQVRVAAEGLTEALGTFTEEQWIEAMGRLDVDEVRAREHLERLKHASVVAQPQHGTFRFVE